MKNIILFAMSTLPKIIVPNDWEIDLIDQKHIDLFKKSKISVEDCKSQLEPITRMIMENVDGSFKLIMICTNAVNTESIDLNEKKLFAVPYFFERLKEKSLLLVDDQIPEHEVENPEFDENGEVSFERFFLPTSSGGDCEVLKINAEFDSIRGIELAVDEICHDYKQEKCRLFIAANGGLREFFLNMAAIGVLLKYKNIEVDGIWSTELNQKKIIDCGNVFSMFEYVSAMNEFMNFGSAKSLSDYFAGFQDDSSSEPIMEAMNKIHYGISYCNIDTYESGLKQFKKATCGAERKGIRGIPQFRMFEEELESDYGNLFKNDDYWYTDLVERCFKKDLMQQALTYNEAKVFDDFFESGILYFDESSLANRSESPKRIKKYDNIYLYISDIKGSVGDKDPIHIVLLKYIMAMFSVEGEVSDLVARVVSNGGEKAFKNLLEVIENINTNRLKKAVKPYLPEKIKTDELFYDKNNSSVEIPNTSFDYVAIDDSVQALTLRTVFGNDKIGRNYKVLAAVTIYLYVILKKVRNTWNHGNEKEQPNVDQLKTLLGIYIECMKKLLDGAKMIGANVNLPDVEKIRTVQITSLPKNKS